MNAIGRWGRRLTSVCAISLGLLGATAANALADPEITSFSTSLTTNGSPNLVAGAHADLNLKFTLATHPDPDSGLNSPNASLKDVDVALPLGSVGNPTTAPKCTQAQLDTSRCPIASQVGLAQLDFGGGPQPTPIYNMQARSDRPAQFGMRLIDSVSILVDVAVRPDGGLTAYLRNVNQGLGLSTVDMTVWGVPAAASHDAERYDPASFSFGHPSGVAPGAFLSNPVRCDGQPLKTTIRLTSWQNPADPSYADATTPGGAITGCDSVPFSPTFDLATDTRVGGAPAGYAIDLGVPQTTDPEVLQAGQLKDATVTLPEGTALNPSTADGLTACSDAQFGVGNDAPVACPGSSQIGELTIDTPVLTSQLSGKAYVAEQKSSDPESGQMYRLFLTASGNGVLIKLSGSIVADSRTGQLTARFDNNPQLPFSRLRLQFKGGSRAPLVTPPTCGRKTTTVRLTSWSGQTRDLTSGFDVTTCADPNQFTPTFEAGTTNPLAGAFSTFSMTVRRDDADQPLAAISASLPSGLLGALGSVPLCDEGRAAAGTCADDTLVGHTTVSAGAGATPYSLGGKVYLAGPYKGAPFSLSIVVPAKAGPFDLGTVVVRSPLQVDANNAKVAAPADPLPTILGGVPLRIRMVNIRLDRPNFIFNATSCAPSTIGAALTGTGGAVANVSSRYQPSGCAGLKLDPSLSLKFTGGKSEMGKFKHPGVEADLSQAFGQSGLKRVQVKLPLAVALDPDNAESLCEPAAAAKRTCPEASIVGHAEAVTPALHEPLKGPIYFVRGERQENGKTVKTLPKLYLKLDGEGVPLDLMADSQLAGKNLVTTFNAIPDAPIRRFVMTVNSGKHGILKTPSGVCDKPKATTITFEGQSGARTVKTVTFTAPDCGLRIVSAAATQRRITARVVGIGAGRLELGGPRLRKAIRKINKADTASIAASMSRATRRSLAQGKKVKVALTVKFRPTKGKAVTLKKTITVKGKKVKKR
ncbi:hypothetical protein [Patulibacter defluvii]|uniref:hypothetical protein n=1 Tax=Patulibacter defluvii TaxID=3095358 RepID=UPI002A75DA54|nr:hypothetical protein [Patulibacter sp. DM4]